MRRIFSDVMSLGQVVPSSEVDFDFAHVAVAKIDYHKIGVRQNLCGSCGIEPFIIRRRLQGYRFRSHFNASNSPERHGSVEARSPSRSRVTMSCHVTLFLFLPIDEISSHSLLRS